jgi:predicted lactoylglutathione lyase
MLLALTRDTREEVDAISEAAATAGGKADIREPMDMGWLYNRAFEDPDGHVFEAVWMDMKAASEMTGKQ